MSEVINGYLVSQEKRTLDVLGSVLIASGLTPLLGAVASLSALDTKSSPLFTQERVGRATNTFNVFKFRTIAKRFTNLAEVQTFGTFDSRASAVGLFLRRSGLDELPQLSNVLMGDMSLVGHRPLLEEDIEKRNGADSGLFSDWYLMYQSTKPGLLGKSQIMRHHYIHGSDDLLIESMKLDLEYAQTASLEVDLRMILSSPLRMLRANIQPVDNRAVAS